MSESFFSLMLNAIIIVLLGATIVYATRLSLHMKAFRDSRKDLERIIRDLSRQIEKAENAILTLKQTARDAGVNLQQQIDESRILRDELQLMNEAGDNLAGRLEKVADRKVRPAPRKEVKRPELSPGFAIRDLEFERGEDDQGMDEAALNIGSEGGLQSRAERELYEALRGKRGGRP